MDLKPRHQGGYTSNHADQCERVLVTLMRGMGPYRDSLILVGGLVPKYLVTADVSGVQPPHVGTTDVDLVVDIQLLANVDAYRTLEQNLLSMGFERDRNDEGQAVNYRWRRDMEESTSVLIDFLQERGDNTNAVTSLPGQKKISALNIEGARIASTHHHAVDIQAELLHGGFTTESVNVIDVAPFLVMKALAFEDRSEPKDAYDLIYVLQHFDGGREVIANGFLELMANEELRPLASKALEIARKRFVSDETTEGHRKDGSAAYAGFLTDPARRELDVIHARDAAAVVSDLVKFIAAVDGDVARGE